MNRYGGLRVLFCVVCLFFSPHLSFAGSQDSDSIQSILGVDVVPNVLWSFPSMLNPHGTDEIDYDMDVTRFTSYAANVRFNKINATLGLNAVVDDSEAGKVDQYAGYLAIKNIFFRYSLGKIRGSAEWLGQQATDMPMAFDYDHDITSYEINYLFTSKNPSKSGMNTGFYVGVGYTSMTVPIEIHTLITPGGKENQQYGVPVYDNGYEAKLFCAQFGFDGMMGDMAAGAIKPGDIRFFGHAQDTIGFGNGTVSDESIAWAEELNPGRTFQDPKSFVAYLQNDSTLGFYWAPSLLRGHGVIALGYNLNFCFLATFEGAASKASELGYDASYGLMRHGPQLRAYLTW